MTNEHDRLVREKEVAEIARLVGRMAELYRPSGDYGAGYQAALDEVAGLLRGRYERSVLTGLATDRDAT